jgi:hypothetical protein
MRGQLRLAAEPCALGHRARGLRWSAAGSDRARTQRFRTARSTSGGHAQSRCRPPRIAERLEAGAFPADQVDDPKQVERRTCLRVDSVGGEVRFRRSENAPRWHTRAAVAVFDAEASNKIVTGKVITRSRAIGLPRGRNLRDFSSNLKARSNSQTNNFNPARTNGHTVGTPFDARTRCAGNASRSPATAFTLWGKCSLRSFRAARTTRLRHALQLLGNALVAIEDHSNHKGADDDRTARTQPSRTAPHPSTHTSNARRSPPARPEHRKTHQRPAGAPPHAL